MSQSEFAFRQIFKDLKSKGKICSPRNQKVIEIENYSYVLPARVRFCSFEARQLKLDYVKREFLWYLQGDNKDLEIAKYASMWKSLINADGTINSNYGHYWFSGEMSQFSAVVKTLSSDKDSRRASMVILSSKHLLSDTKDVPCTYSLNFRIRNSKLNMTVHMRSQDAIFGMGNDAPCFSFIHEMVYTELLTTYPDLQMGEYCHFADSFHLYERHFEMLEALATDSPYLEVDCPEMVATEATSLISQQFQPFNFTNWLTNFSK